MCFLFRWFYRIFVSATCPICGVDILDHEYCCDECYADLRICDEIDYYGHSLYLDDETRARIERKGLM